MRRNCYCLESSKNDHQILEPTPQKLQLQRWINRDDSFKIFYSQFFIVLRIFFLFCKKKKNACAIENRQSLSIAPHPLLNEKHTNTPFTSLSRSKSQAWIKKTQTFSGILKITLAILCCKARKQLFLSQNLEIEIVTDSKGSSPAVKMNSLVDFCASKTKTSPFSQKKEMVHLGCCNMIPQRYSAT